MKKEIHPAFHTDAKVTCACGNSFVTGSTAKSINVEICSMCHPFFTGKQKLVDDRGRVERFKRLMEKRSQMSAGQDKKAKQAARTKNKQGKQQEQ